MNAILKKDNVFVYVKNLNEEVKNDSLFVMDCKNYGDANLYGGRVTLSSYENCCRIEIDGVDICQCAGGDSKVYLDNELPYSTIVAYLNQIEALGVDTFLANYKKTMEEFKEDLSVQADKLEATLSVNDNDEGRGQLISMRNVLCRLSCLIFCLSINMFAGIDNHIYEEAYQYFVNLYQEA